MLAFLGAIKTTTWLGSFGADHPKPLPETTSIMAHQCGHVPPDNAAHTTSRLSQNQNFVSGSESIPGSGLRRRLQQVWPRTSCRMTVWAKTVICSGNECIRSPATSGDDMRRWAPSGDDMLAKLKPSRKRGGSYLFFKICFKPTAPRPLAYRTVRPFRA